MRATIVIALLAGLLSPSVTERSTPHTRLHADRVLVLKKQRTLELLSQGRVIKTFKVALGGDPLRAQDQTRRSQDSRRRVRSKFSQCSQPVLQIDPYLIPQRS